MEVKYVDIGARYRNNRTMKNTVLAVLEKGQFILGSAVGKFERNFARFCGVKYAVSLSSGTDALFLALKALGIGKGDEVITAPNSFVATAGAIAATGAFPRMADVDEDYNISVRQVEKNINKNTRAIIPVHLTGNPARMDEICRLAGKHKLFVIEDACQAIGASIGRRKTGSMGDMAAFSLHPLKNLSTCGDGGVLTTNSEKFYNKLVLYRNHGLIDRNESGFFAFNSRLDTLKAAVADLQLKNIEAVTKKRIEHAMFYDNSFKGLVKYIKLPKRSSGVRQVFHTYIAQVERRNELIKFLKNKNIETKIHYPIPIHLMKASKPYGYKKGDFPVAEKQAEKIISLPVREKLTKAQLVYVVDCVYEFYGMKRSRFCY